MPAIFHVKIEDESFDGAVNHIVEASDDDTVWHCEEAGDNFDGAIFHVKWAEDGHEEPVWRVSGISRGTVTTVGPAVSPLLLPDAIANSLQYVKAFGGTEQNGTPTPDAPMDIVSNNGVLKVSPNICTWNQSLTATGNGSAAIAYSGIFTPSGYPFKQNTQYTISFDVVGDNITYSASGNLLYFIVEYTDGSVTYPGVTGGNYQNGRFVWNTSADKTVRRIGQFNKHARWTGGTITVSNMRIEEGSSATTSIYADGMVETICDSAGHTATAQMLLSVGDYKDEQNITTGAITRKVGVKVFDGVSTGAKAIAVNVNQGKYYAVCGGQTNITATTTDLLSTHFKAGAFASGYDIVYAIATNIVLVSSNQSLTTVDSYNQWLADQYANGTPVIVVYPLATETTESVTGQTLQVTQGDNVLEITQASIDGLELEAKYMKGVVASAQEVEPQGLDNNVSVSLS